MTSASDETDNRDAGEQSSNLSLASDEKRRSDLYLANQFDIAALQRSAFALAELRRSFGDKSAVGNFALHLIEKSPQSYSQLLQDLFALYFADNKQGGYFVEVGTGDGILISNSYLLEKNYGWRGMVVEPNPVFLPSLRANRSCTISTDCVLDVTGRTVSFDCTVTPEFSGVTDQLGDLTAAPSNIAQHTATMSTIELTTVSLNDLLERSGAPGEIDYISLDVEGAELTILNTFDFDRWKVACFTIEHNFDPRREDMYQLMTANGYSRVFTGISQWDDWYVRTDLLKNRPDFEELQALSSPVSAAPAPQASAQSSVSAEEIVNLVDQRVKDISLGIASAIADAFLSATPPGTDPAIDEVWGPYLTAMRKTIAPLRYHSSNILQEARKESELSETALRCQIEEKYKECALLRQGLDNKEEAYQRELNQRSSELEEARRALERVRRSRWFRFGRRLGLT